MQLPKNVLSIRWMFDVSNKRQSPEVGFGHLVSFMKHVGGPVPGRAIGGALRAIYLDGKNPVWVIRGRDIATRESPNDAHIMLLSSEIGRLTLGNEQ